MRVLWVKDLLFFLWEIQWKIIPPQDHGLASMDPLTIFLELWVLASDAEKQVILLVDVLFENNGPSGCSEGR